MRKKLVMAGALFCGLGLLGLAVLFVSGTAYPDTLFNLLTPVSLLLLIIAIPFFAVAWIMTIHREIQEKHHGIAALWAISGLLLMIYELCRIL